MVIDSSVVIAIALSETDYRVYIEAISKAFYRHARVCMPASVLVEAGIIAEARNFAGELNEVIDSMQPEIIPLDATIANLSRDAFRRFGRGRHEAQLNFGDCMSYATATHLRLPLLYKGEDFSRTDIPSALA